MIMNIKDASVKKIKNLVYLYNSIYYSLCRLRAMSAKSHVL